MHGFCQASRSSKYGHSDMEFDNTQLDAPLMHFWLHWCATVQSPLITYMYYEKTVTGSVVEALRLWCHPLWFKWYTTSTDWVAHVPYHSTNTSAHRTYLKSISAEPDQSDTVPWKVDTLPLHRELEVVAMAGVGCIINSGEQMCKNSKHTQTKASTDQHHHTHPHPQPQTTVYTHSRVVPLLPRLLEPRVQNSCVIAYQCSSILG